MDRGAGTQGGAWEDGMHIEPVDTAPEQGRCKQRDQDGWKWRSGFNLVLEEVLQDRRWRSDYLPVRSWQWVTENTHKQAILCPQQAYKWAPTGSKRTRKQALTCSFWGADRQGWKHLRGKAESPGAEGKRRKR